MSWIQSAFKTRISPVILFIIVILAFLLSAAALLRLLIRFLLKQRPTPPIPHPELSTSGAFQRQLQQLFHLHDSGLDQSYIDSLPVFLYKDVVGSKEPFDCAVCLCEFTELDRLRLLPLCSHAFHLECIDTWLLSNSSCPLCRGVILSFENPVFYFGDVKEVEDGNSGFSGESNSAVINEKRVFSVRLGKLRGVSGGGGEVGEGSNGNLDCRRCYSMGSFQYVVADSELQVALFPSRREEGREGQNGNFGQGQNGNFAGDRDWGGDDGKKINNRAKGESFSVSKIWLWSKKGRVESSETTLYSNAINVGLP